MSANYQTLDGVAVITLNNPPVNGLGHDTRRGITDGLDRAQADAAVKAIVLVGAGKLFSGGADIREFDTPKSFAEPNLLSVILALEACAKPVVAAVHGTAMGGGLELSLGCHYRVAAPGTQVALPEVKLGLIPGAGGTQRLPRVIGIENALNMIVSGEAVRSEQLAQIPGQMLFDRIVEGDLLAGAVSFAEEVAERRPLPLVRDLKATHPNADAWFQFARNTVGAMAKGFPAPLKCIDAVAASVRKPFDEGLRIEREMFVLLMNSPESRALRHVFAAERAATKIADLAPGTKLREIRQVGVVGAGTMGVGITMNFLNAGIPVVLLEMKQEALDKGVATIRHNYENTMKKGRLKPEQVEERMALVKPTLSYEAFADVDLVIEAVFEELGVKKAVFEALDKVCRRGAILASNTSYLDVDRIAEFTRRPADVLGLHFFSPANVMRLLEIVRGAKTAPDVLATCMALAKSIRKVAVVAGVCDGFIGNRMVSRYGAAALQLIEAGALPQQVDGALERFGMAMGPIRMGDLAGLDIGWATRKRRAAAAGTPLPPSIANLLCETGRFGQKTGAGWYRYDAGNRTPIPDEATVKLIEQFRKAQGITPRKISDEEIVERCIFALVNEGARIVDEGIAARASDIDVVYLNGYGFPLKRGGPMLYADMIGLPGVVRSLRKFAAEPGADASWQPAPLLEKLADEGRTFNGS